MVTGARIAELSCVTEDGLSFYDYVEEVSPLSPIRQCRYHAWQIFQFRYTLGPSFAHQHHYINVLKQHVSSSLLPSLYIETFRCREARFPRFPGSWTRFPHQWNNS